MVRWIKRNAALIVAVLALFVSAYSVYLDRQFKELSIQPRIISEFNGADFSITLRNAGLGPAEISRIVYFFDGRCFEIGQLSLSERSLLGSHLIKYLYRDVVQGSGTPIEVPLPGGVGPQVIIDWSAVPIIVPAGSTRSLFTLSSHQANAIQEKISELHGDESSGIARRFMAAANGLPMAMSFCSLTGGYCVSQTMKNCPPPPKKKPQ